MVEALDDEPHFHSVVWACGEIILQLLPRLDNGFVREQLKARDFVPKGIGLSQRKELGKKCIGWSTSPRWTQLPCWRRTTALPSPIMRMEKWWRRTASWVIPRMVNVF
jgi:hypothetical protein